MKKKHKWVFFYETPCSNRDPAYWAALLIETKDVTTTSGLHYSLGDFTFWLRLSLRLSPGLNFGLSIYLSQKVKWFRWARIHFDFLTLAERQHGDYLQFCTDKRRNGYIVT